MIDISSINKKMIYNPLDDTSATTELNTILFLLESFLDMSTLSAKDLSRNDALLLKMVIRIDQRSDYFTYFHSELDENNDVIVDQMSQIKRIALLCFWILKYKPFSIVDRKKEQAYYAQNRCTVNETFAAYLFVSQICTSKIVSKKQKNYYRSTEYLSDLFYKFMNHDISKEAMIFALCSIVCCK